MVALSAPVALRPPHPLHAVLLSFPFPLFLGTLLSDIAYERSYQIQWSNFAQWLNAATGGGSCIPCWSWRCGCWGC